MKTAKGLPFAVFSLAVCKLFPVGMPIICLMPNRKPIANGFLMQQIPFVSRRPGNLSQADFPHFLYNKERYSMEMEHKEIL